ncbi:MAG: alpha-L-fucosidase [Bacteroidales bacterium]
MMKRAAVDLQKLIAVNESGPYKPTIESLDTHLLPEWFEDAKLGIFMDWGPWSVAGYATPRDPKLGTGGSYPDWYEFLMDNAYKAYHDTVWGVDFRRDDFLPLLTGSNFNAMEYMNLAVEAGAKYFVPFARHHGGWAMWESQYTLRNAKEMGPKRDIYKEIAEAARKKGMKIGLYFSISEWEYPVIVDTRVTQWDPTGHLGVFKDGLGLFLEQKAYPRSPDYLVSGFFPAVVDRMLSGKIPVRNYFSDYMMPLFKEAVDKYDPDLIWYDGPGSSVDMSLTPELLAYFYNQAEGRKEVVINDRAGMFISMSDFTSDNQETSTEDLWEKAFRLGDYRTPEYDYERTGIGSKKWEVCRSISPSFGYNWTDNEENSLTSEELIKMFIGIVAGNGNLLLVINPDGSGKLSDLQKGRLIELGNWLKVNSEGIYSTRAYSVLKDGTKFYTTSKDGKYLYIHCTECPGRSLRVNGISPVSGSMITMLGVKNSLRWRKSGSDLEVTIPNNLQNESNRPCKYAWVLKVQIK